MARPLPPKDDSRRTTIAVLAVGGFVVAGLVGAGVFILLRQPVASAVTAPAAAAALPPAAGAAPSRPEPTSLLADAHREARAWHRDAVLVSVSAKPLDARGVVAGGKVEITFAKPGGQRISGGAEASGERLVLSSGDGTLAKSEERAAKARISPEPNCLFENAWTSAQRAGVDANAGVGLRYGWSEKHSRPVWEVAGSDGQVLRRLDGVSCSILTR